MPQGITIATAFWNTFNYVTAPIGLETQLQTINAFNNTELATQISNFNRILDKVYYFIPQEMCVTILGIAFATISIRIIMAIVNLIWW